MRQSRGTAKPCREKRALRQRPRMTARHASEVGDVFGVLANNTRLRILHEIVLHDEACTSELAASLAMKPQAISNQLQRLQDKGILASRRDGNSIYYRIVDHCVVILLERALCLVEETKRRGRLAATT